MVNAAIISKKAPKTSGRTDSTISKKGIMMPQNQYKMINQPSIMNEFETNLSINSLQGQNRQEQNANKAARNKKKNFSTMTTEVVDI